MTGPNRSRGGFGSWGPGCRTEQSTLCQAGQETTLPWPGNRGLAQDGACTSWGGGGEERLQVSGPRVNVWWLRWPRERVNCHWLNRKGRAWFLQIYHDWYRWSWRVQPRSWTPPNGCTDGASSGCGRRKGLTCIKYLALDPAFPPAHTYLVCTMCQPLSSTTWVLTTPPKKTLSHRECSHLSEVTHLAKVEPEFWPWCPGSRARLHPLCWLLPWRLFFIPTTTMGENSHDLYFPQTYKLRRRTVKCLVLSHALNKPRIPASIWVGKAHPPSPPLSPGETRWRLYGWVFFFLK